MTKRRRITRLMPALAAVMFVVLLSIYVHLLHHSVARGESLRQEQKLGVTANKPESAGRARVARESAAQTRAVASTR